MEQLIEQCLKKDATAQEKLYETYRKQLFAVCLKYTSSYAEAEDHLHDVFIEIFQKIQNYKGKGSFEGWMKRIAINKAIDKHKKKKVFELPAYRLGSLSDDAHEIYLEMEHIKIPFEKLMEFIQELPNQYQLVFSLYELDGYSHRQISALTGITEGTSKSNLFRAKMNLKKQILEYTNHNHKRLGHEG
ncbi:MAG: RNA polymerase sigma factor [Croceivirga sp.]